MRNTRFPAVEKVPDPENNSGSRDPKVQTEILNQQIRALARAGFNILIPMPAHFPKNKTGDRIRVRPPFSLFSLTSPRIPTVRGYCRIRG